MNSLDRRVLQASAWMLLGHGAGQLLRLLGNLIMTRLLVPEMFGLMSVAWILMSGLQLLSDMGIRQSIVQSKRGDDPVFLGTAWATQILRGGVLWLLGLGVAGSIRAAQTLELIPPATVYADPVFPVVISVLAAIAFIGGFESTRIALADRNLALARIARMDILAQVAGMACMIAWALVDRSIWALVAGGIVTALVRTLLSHLLLPGANDRWIWNADAFREILKFGKWIFLNSVLGFAVNSGDRLLLGGLVDARALGLYAIAFLIVDAAALVISKLLGAVSFPALSEVARERPAEFRTAYYRFRLPVDLLALFTAGALFAGGDAVVKVLFDDRYAAAGPIVGILSCSLFFIRYGVTEMCCLALGKPRILSSQIAARGVALFALVPLAFHAFGFAGALWAIALHRAFSLLPILHFKLTHKLLDVRRELIVLPALPLGIAAGAAFTLIAARFGWT
ncbi:MAG: oligosaccharide flippase family protein [Pseudomonadota bacterium]